mgnify:CR=1 FL=1
MGTQVRYSQQQVELLMAEARAEAREEVLANVTTEWGVHWVGDRGRYKDSPVDDRETAETIVRNVKNSEGTLYAEVIWRGVTPWLKEEEAD